MELAARRRIPPGRGGGPFQLSIVTSDAGGDSDGFVTCPDLLLFSGAPYLTCSRRCLITLQKLLNRPEPFC